MPTSDDYNAAASRFRAIGTTLDATQVGRASDRWVAFGDGPVADEVDAQMTSIVGDVVVAADECRRLAAVCEQRAEICDQYRRDMQRYWIRLLIDPWARRPTRPAPWADV